MRCLLALFVASILAAAPAMASCPTPRQSQYQRANAYLATGGCIETAFDVTASATIMRNVPTIGEANPLIPPQVVLQMRRGNPLGAFVLGCGAFWTTYFVTRCDAPYFLAVGFVGEGINDFHERSVLRAHGLRISIGIRTGGR